MSAVTLNRLWAPGDKRVDPQETLTWWMERAAVLAVAREV